MSGVVDPDRGLHTGMVPLAAFTACRLRVGRDELKQRFLHRGGQADMLEEVLSEADAIDASDFADVCVDTSGLPARQTRDAAASARQQLLKSLASLPIVRSPGAGLVATSPSRPPLTMLIRVPGLGPSGEQPADLPGGQRDELSCAGKGVGGRATCGSSGSFP